MAKSERFGTLLTEGIKTTAHKQHKGIGELEQIIAQNLHFTQSNIQRWRRGYIPPNLAHIEYVVSYCVTHGGLGHKWAKNLFISANYLSHNSFLKTIFPNSEDTEQVDTVSYYRNAPGLPIRPKLIGRERELARLHKGLFSPRYPIVSIEGIPGIGKTALAIEIGHYCLSLNLSNVEPSFEYIVWISARNRLDQREWLSNVLDRTAEVLEHSHLLDLPKDQKSEEIDRLLSRNRVLIILDNFETMRFDAELVDWLEDIPIPSKVLLTSRTIDIRSSWVVTLKGLLDGEAISYVRVCAEDKSIEGLITASDEALLPLVEVTGGNPKAIEMSLDHIRTHGWTIGDLVNRLYQGNKTVTNVLDYIVDWGWKVLSENARKLLIVISFFSKATDSALLATTGWTEYVLDKAKEDLIGMSFVDIEGDATLVERRYFLHPIIRSYTANQLVNYGAWEQESRERWVTYYLDFLEDKVCRVKIAHPYWKYLGGGRIQTMGQDWPTLLNMLEWADCQGEHAVLVKIMERLVHYMDRRAYDDIRIQYARKAAVAANTLNLPTTESLFRIDALSLTLRKTGRYNEAFQELNLGKECIEMLKVDDPAKCDLKALALAFEAKVYIERAARNSEDLEHAQKLLVQAEDYVAKCMPVVQHRVFVVKGDLAHKQHRYSDAIELYRMAESTWLPYMMDGDTDMAGIHRKLGFCYLDAGDIDEAQSHFLEVLSYEGQGGILNDCQSKVGLAKIMKICNQEESARRYALSAREGLSYHHPLHRVIDEVLDQISHY